MNMKNVKRMLGAMVLVLASNTAFAGGKVVLVATLNDQPAMRPVHWVVKKAGGGIAANERRHSLSLDLPPGKYTATAKLDSVERSRTFSVTASTDTTIVVAMD